MAADSLGDELHRAVKLALDSGEAASLREAEALFRRYRLRIDVGPDVLQSPTRQAAVLTSVNTARRCFLGGVKVTGALDAPLLVPWRSCRTLRDAIIDLQGTVSTDADETTEGIPRIVVGDTTRSYAHAPFAVRATFDGWRGGAVPLADGIRLPEQQEFTPAGVLAGAMAVSEAFQYVRGGNPHAGKRVAGMSLWRLEDTSWLTSSDSGPSLTYLPTRLWLIGLGHLGQAFLWTLGFLPYAQPAEVQLVLQDYDALVAANDSTSLLTTSALIGQRKTRAMARWCEQRGFGTVLIERRFANNFQVDGDEPQLALCGVDNAAARAALELVGFKRIIEAGLGKGAQEYLAYQVHTFPASRSAKERWGSAVTAPADEALLAQPAYQALEHAGVDRCGLTLLAGRSVGSSFVGAAVSTIVIAEVLRMLAGEHSYEVVDGTLRSPKGREAILSEGNLEAFNPGSTDRILY
ncbi:MAG TPA: thiamine biosynthesis protein ThiF [Chloroflexia bacterium]|jgi:hypothetical protein